MLNFKPILLSDKAEIEKYLQLHPYRASDGSFANLYLWQKQYETKFCIEDGFLFINGGLYGDLDFMCPLGEGDLREALYKVKHFAENCGIKPQLVGVTEEMRDRIESAMPKELMYSESRDEEDYIYLSSELANLNGKKYHSKRNFIHRFFDKYDDIYSYEPITQKNIDLVVPYHNKWFKQNADYEHEFYEMLSEEIHGVEKMLECFEELKARGGILKVDGNVIAYTMGTKSAFDTFVVQFEKADFDIVGAYQVINKLFSTDCLDFKYLNREDDMGKLGLRKSKLSYHPYKMLVKYKAVWKEC